MIYEFTKGIAGKLLTTLDRGFNKIWTSEFNPLYRSGTIAVALLFAVTLTGFYLIFFYRLSAPYDSVLAINDQVFLGRWIRTFHRYASDAAVFMVIVHILRMYAQKKSWGPRAFAWITGVFLLGLLFISGWTGYVMIWDEHGQALAMAGAKIFDALGIFSDSIARSFNGSAAKPPPSFFFFNLFLHVVLPLSMIFGVWAHTAKMARATWFPHKRLLVSLMGLFVFVSLFWPADLGDRADLLSLPSEYPIDWFFNFWLPWASSHPLAVAGFIGGALIFLVLMPFLLSPKAEQRLKPADLEDKKCVGCSQCSLDCPYEAIRMVERTTEPRHHDLVARVDPNLCVSCGLCAASCDPMTIGPETRKASDQHHSAKDFAETLIKSGEDLSNQIVVIGCHNQSLTVNQLSQMISREGDMKLYPVHCMGTLHMATIGSLALHFRSVILAACPERNCTNKDAFFLLRERLSGAREPGLPSRVDPQRVQLIAVGEGEESKVIHLNRQIKGSELPQKPSRRSDWLAASASLFLILVTAFFSAFPRAATNTESVIRLSWRLPSQSVKICKERSAEELAKLPQHMRTPKTCDERKLSYKLNVSLDQQALISKTIHPGGFRRDRPLYVSEDLSLAPGTHHLKIEFSPIDDTTSDSIRLDFDGPVRVEQGRISLIQTSDDQRSLLVKEWQPSN